MNKMFRRSAIFTISISIIAGCGLAYGEAATDPNMTASTATTPTPASGFGSQSPTETRGEADDNGIQEIIVTANKRDERLSNVGSSISAFSGEMLAERKIDSPEALARTIPSLELLESTHGTPVYNLRGVGYNGDALGVYPAVSLSLDQGPLTFPVLANHTLYDLERVEILKGPQGTLFGQNSTGGQINYVAAKPTSNFEAGGSLEYGRFNEARASGFISGPLTDTLGVRVAFDAARRDGWQYSITRDATNGKENYGAGRLILDWKPSSRLTFELDVNGSVDKSQPQALQLIAVLPTTPTSPSVAELTSPFAPSNARAADWSASGSNPRSNRQLFQTILRGDYEISDAVKLTSITTYGHLNQDASYDVDGSAYHLVDVSQDNGSIDDLSQELRLSNAGSIGAPLRWTVGGTFNHSNTSELQEIIYPDNSLNIPALNNITYDYVTSASRIKTYAAFANTEYDLTSRIVLKGGLRYTKSVNKNDACVFGGNDKNVTDLFTNLGLLVGGVRVPLGPNDCFSFNADNLPNQAHSLNELKEDNVSWRVGSDFKLTPDTLLYANISRGYKAGSFPVVTVSTVSSLTPAHQESVTSYETGIKTKLFDNRAQLNIAAYYSDYKDKQVQGTTLSNLFGLLQNLQNVPKSHIYGVEADVTFRPLKGLTLAGSAAYLKSAVDQYTALSTFGVMTDFKGDRLPFAPTFSASGDIDYRITTASGGALFMGGAVTYQSNTDAYLSGSSLVVPDNGANRSAYVHPFHIPGYALVDARLGYELPGDKLTVSVFGKNVFNKFYVTNAISYNDNIPRSVGLPATWGVSASYKF